MPRFTYSSPMGDPGKAEQVERNKSLAQRALIGKRRGVGSWRHIRKSQRGRKPMNQK